MSSAGVSLPHALNALSRKKTSPATKAMGGTQSARKPSTALT